MQWRLSSLSLPIDESSDGGLVTSLSTFLELDGVDLLFDEPHLGGKDNLPLSVIPIVHQQRIFVGKMASNLCAKSQVQDKRHQACFTPLEALLSN